MSIKRETNKERETIEKGKELRKIQEITHNINTGEEKKTIEGSEESKDEEKGLDKVYKRQY